MINLKWLNYGPFSLWTTFVYYAFIIHFINTYEWRHRHIDMNRIVFISHTYTVIPIGPIKIFLIKLISNLFTNRHPTRQSTLIPKPTFCIFNLVTIISALCSFIIVNVTPPLIVKLSLLSCKRNRRKLPNPWNVLNVSAKTTMHFYKHDSIFYLRYI